MGADEQAARAVELSVEALTLIKAHIVECNTRNLETVAGLSDVKRDLSSLKNYTITLLLSVVGFLVAKLAGWL